MKNYLNNSSLESMIKNEWREYRLLAFSIYQAQDAGGNPLEDDESHWELSVCSTSLSELDGSEEGGLGEFSYVDEHEAREDIATAQREYGIMFDEI
jgi:hypothetical protein